MPARQETEQVVVNRGVQLFKLLVGEANAGRPTGIGYAAFLVHIHGARSYRELKGRGFVPRDVREVLRFSAEVTHAAGGRKEVSKGDLCILTGMDAFIWSSQFPYDRPPEAWKGDWAIENYSREEWQTIFPDGGRRLIS